MRLVVKTISKLVTIFSLGMISATVSSHPLLLLQQGQIARAQLYPGSVNNPSTSCQAILAGNGSFGNGLYWITASGSTFQVYCDMTDDGGGWTRLNSNLATLTGASFGSSDSITDNNVGANESCSVPGEAFSISGVTIPMSSVRMNLTRQETVTQCPGLYLPASATTIGVSLNNTYYWNGSAWVPNVICTWGDNIWAYGTHNISISGLQNVWKTIYTSVSSPSAFRFGSLCNLMSDNGQIQVTIWFK